VGWKVKFGGGFRVRLKVNWIGSGSSPESEVRPEFKGQSQSPGSEVKLSQGRRVRVRIQGQIQGQGQSNADIRLFE
jgi:hypothetical protein